MTDKEILCAWQKKRLETVHADRCDYGVGRSDVTVLAYYWGADSATPDTEFYRIESAFRETWLQCGMMKSVIVTDRVSPEMRRFADKFPSVEFQEEPSLVAGSLFSMSKDCNGRLYSRFATPWVLVVQDDGFPLRPGLDEFVGKWDFVGAPYVRDLPLQRLVAGLFNYWPQNGGFSLRSKRICEVAAKYWNEKYYDLPERGGASEDMFYTMTLIKLERSYRRDMKLSDNRTGFRFSWDKEVGACPRELPFGFHRATSFCDLQARFCHA